MFMDPLSSINHLLNFLAPAFAVALVLVVGSQIFDRKRAKTVGWLKPIAINFVIGATVLQGLIVFGNDGKIWTYGGLVVISATSQFFLLRSWRG